jgi:hypothetical protein
MRLPLANFCPSSTVAQNFEISRLLVGPQQNGEIEDPFSDFHFAEQMP